MRDIRARISQRHGIELTTQQIQELAARRLEAILDPRTVKPSLLEQIRRSAATPLDAPPAAELIVQFEDTTLYDSHRGSLQVHSPAAESAAQAVLQSEPDDFGAQHTGQTEQSRGAA